MLSGHRSVYLRRCEFGVSKEILDRPKIGTVLKQMGGEGVTKGVGKGTNAIVDHAAYPSDREVTTTHTYPQHRASPTIE